MKKEFRNLLLIILTIVLVLAFSCANPSNNNNVEAAQEQNTQNTQNEENIQAENQSSLEFNLVAINNRVSSLVEEVTPSVVSIQVGVLVENMLGQEQLETGIGSGVILDEEGYILTNSHVVGDAQELLVILDDGTRVNAQLVGANQQTDVGVIKIDPADLDLQPATLGSIENEEVGELVIAVGSPFGIQQTVTLGIISGKGRIIPTASDLLPIVDAIQTDAAINPGNSGGPLINIDGEVIGINTLGISPSGASSGVGFAIPIDTSINIAEQIIQYGEARIPFMGIEIGQNDTDVAGALIANVVEDSPAERAGLRPGDIIVEFNGKEIGTPFQILSQLLRQDCGQEVQLRIYRDGEYMELTVELEECPTPS